MSTWEQNDGNRRFTEQLAHEATVATGQVAVPRQDHEIDVELVDGVAQRTRCVTDPRLEAYP